MIFYNSQQLAESSCQCLMKDFYVSTLCILILS